MSMGLAVGAPLVLGEPWVWEMRAAQRVIRNLVLLFLIKH